MITRRRFMFGAMLFFLLLALDQLQRPECQVSANLLLVAIHGYQATLSKAMPALGVRCRFIPSCSHYGEGAIRKYGAVLGSIRTAARIARCGPWTPLGTYDPP
ncbi:MAG TPA: membrane protein insertion efficiency factor YidD [Thermoanaerobaculia bacterium]|jgi:putative membrane protein insertion efficiency factor|nr:membrane protein insertion efficiency factor YidD [Thermoanaerobaculia bacterium]